MKKRFIFFRIILPIWFLLLLVWDWIFPGSVFNDYSPSKIAIFIYFAVTLLLFVWDRVFYASQKCFHQKKWTALLKYRWFAECCPTRLKDSFSYSFAVAFFELNQDAEFEKYMGVLSHKTLIHRKHAWFAIIELLCKDNIAEYRKLRSQLDASLSSASSASIKDDIQFFVQLCDIAEKKKQATLTDEEKNILNELHSERLRKLLS